MIKVTLEVEVPDLQKMELLLGMLRMFNRHNAGCSMRCIANAPDSASVEDVADMLERIGIPLIFKGRRQ